MKPMNRRIAVLGLAALLLVGAGGALAFGGARDHHGGCDRDNRQSPQALLSQLNDLTQEQRTELRQIQRSARDAMRELRDKMVDNRLSLQDAIADRADLETIQKLAETQGDQMAQMIVLRVQIRDQVYGVLTPAQREQLDSLRRPGGDFGPHRSAMGL